LLDRLEASRISVIALKGPPLAEALYPDAALRPSFDLDLQIRPSDLAATLDLLAREGYALPGRLAHLPARRIVNFDSEVVLHKHRGVAVDLHWAVAPDDYPFAFDADFLWRSARSTRFRGREIRALAPECLLLYLSVHGAKHAWSKLIWLADIARLVEKDIDWNA